MDTNLENIFVLLEELTNEKLEELSSLNKSLVRMRMRKGDPKRMNKIENNIRSIWNLLQPIHPILKEQHPDIVEEINQLSLF